MQCSSFMEYPKMLRDSLAYKDNQKILDYAETLAEPIQRFADVLEKELTTAGEDNR